MAHDQAVDIRNLRFAYPQSPHAPVLDVPVWQVDRGEQVFLHGASGAGKSTLLGVLAGILQPQTGQVLVSGTYLTSLSASRRDHFRSKHIGYVFQQFNLIPYLSAMENVMLGAFFAGTSNSVQDRAKQLFDALQVPKSLLKSPVRQLSAGQQQRVAIVRALINQPELLIVDEPTSALDVKNRDGFINVMQQQLQREGTTLIFVSHDCALAQYFERQDDLADINRAGARV